MPYMRIPLVDKQRVVDAFHNDEDYVEAASLLGISRAAAYGIVRRFETTGDVALRRGGFQQEVAKMDNEMAACLVDIVQDFPAYTLAQIIVELQTAIAK